LTSSQEIRFSYIKRKHGSQSAEKSFVVNALEITHLAKQETDDEKSLRANENLTKVINKKITT